jgi:hypothetical protein
MNDRMTSVPFRYLSVPSLSTSLGALRQWSFYGFAPTNGLIYTNQYVNYTLTQLISGQTKQLGRLLAPANVKYIFVVWNTSEPDFGNGAIDWIAEGELSLQTNSILAGNSTLFSRLLNMQTDLRLVANSSNYLIYENLDYLPRISVFSSLTYVSGGLNSLSPIVRLPWSGISDNVFVFGNQHNSQSLLSLSDSVLFYNGNSDQINRGFNIIAGFQVAADEKTLPVVGISPGILIMRCFGAVD